MNSTTIQLSWNAPSADTHNGLIVQYRIRVEDDQSKDVYFLNTTGTTFTVTNLHPYFIYVFSIAAVTELGVGPHSDTVTITASEDGVFMIIYFSGCFLVHGIMLRVYAVY